MINTINGSAIASGINEKVAHGINDHLKNCGRKPKLVSLLVGDSKDACIYVNMQRKASEKVGIEFVSLELDITSNYDDILNEIEKLNTDETVTAVILQKPLPEGIDHSRLVEAINYEKDAEGIHPYNLGCILRREANIVPCTPGAVMKILRVHGIDLYGKEVVILGHSAIVGKPLSLMMLNEMATTTVCHLGTSEKGDIKEHTRNADILVVAVGCGEMVTGDWVSEGTVVIDVGINKSENGIVGDVCFREVAKKAELITPVPGGVGPVTVSILMRNVFRAFIAQEEKRK